MRFLSCVYLALNWERGISILILFILTILFLHTKFTKHRKYEKKKYPLTHDPKINTLNISKDFHLLSFLSVTYIISHPACGQPDPWLVSSHSFFFFAGRSPVILSFRARGAWGPQVNFSVQFSSVQSLSRIWLFATPWTAACQASRSITNSQSLPKLMSIESVMPSNHLILCRPLLLPPSIFPSIRVFSNEAVLHIRWPKHWSFNISPSNEYSGLISFRMDWLDLLAVDFCCSC